MTLATISFLFSSVAGALFLMSFAFCLYAAYASRKFIPERDGYIGWSVAFFVISYFFVAIGVVLW